MVSSGLSIVFSRSVEYKQTLSSKTTGMTKEPRLVNKKGCWLGIPWELTKGGMGQTRLWGAAHCPLWIQLPTNSQRLQKPELKSSSVQVCGIPLTSNSAWRGLLVFLISGIQEPDTHGGAGPRHLAHSIFHLEKPGLRPGALPDSCPTVEAPGAGLGSPLPAISSQPAQCCAPLSGLCKSPFPHPHSTSGAPPRPTPPGLGSGLLSHD